MTTERLHKVMARAGVASRRRSEELILRGLVRVDGQVVRELGVKVDPGTSTIEVMGKPINPGAQRNYLLLNKPLGYLTTVVDPFGRPTVMKLLPEGAAGLFPVGRLDLNSEGLLIMTDDGDLAYYLTHPKHKVPKTYVVVVRGLPNTDAIWKLRQGVDLEDGKTQPATVRIIDRGIGKATLEITIGEGRKRQIRRMCQAVGHHVLSLKRIAIGPIKLADLKPGQTRQLSRQELADLNRAVARV
ncbi:MAG: pseudouridine synthase [Actinomycetota bacterium]|nr:pseudouridine synthase [Actinomycetota bacterium]